MTLKVQGRIARNIYGKWVLGYYRVPTDPGTYTAVQARGNSRPALLRKAKRLGMERVYVGNGFKTQKV